MSRLGAAQIGQRVVVRHRIPDGRATDVLGELVALTAQTLTVRDRTGVEHVIAQSDIVAAKVVPPARERPERPEPGAADSR